MFQSTIDDSKPDHIYLDCLVSNSSDANTPATFLTFTEIRDQAILDVCSDYYLCIERFYLETSNLPLLLMPILTGQTDINKSSLSVTMTYKGYQYQQYLHYVPSNLSVGSPNTPVVSVDYSTTYYDIYSYQNFIKMLNYAFIQCYKGLSITAGQGGFPLPSAYPPYMEFDPNAEKAILNADILGYDQSLLNPISIYMNSPLFQLFSSFDATFYGSTNIVNGMNYMLNVYAFPNSGNVFSVTQPTAINYLQCYQEYPTLGVVGNPVSSILFTTNMIPVSGALVSTPVIFNSTSTGQQTSNSAVSNMLTDITVGLTLGFEYKPNIIYNANPFRLISMQSEAPLRQYDISVFYKLHNGILRAFFLSPGSVSSIKIAFIKKSAKHL